MEKEISKTGYPHIDRPWLQFYGNIEYNKENTSTSIVDYLNKKTKAHAASTAFTFYGKKINYSLLMKNIGSAAKILSLLGVEPEDRILYLMPNIPETAYFMYGASKVGAISDFIDPRPDSIDMKISAEKILSLANAEKSKYIIALDQCYVGMIKPIEEELSKIGVKKIIIVSATDSMNLPNTLNYLREVYHLKGIAGLKSQLNKTKQMAELLKQALSSKIIPTYKYKELVKLAQDEEIEGVDFKDNQISVIVHTSGTSNAKPKPICLTNENLNEYAEQTEISNMPMQPEDKALHILPYFAAFGLVGVVHAGLAHNNNLIEIPEFDPKGLGYIILKNKPQTIIGPPTWFLTLIEDPILKNADLSFVKMITYGGDSMEPEDEVRVNTFLAKHNCPVKITKGHGMSETCGCASYATGDYNKLGSMGIPLPESIYTIVDPETKKPIKFNEDEEYIEGEIAISSPTMTPGTLDGETITPKITIDNKEYILTKDIARMYKNGIMYFLSRSDRSFMRYDGFKVKPYEIEKIIKQDIKIKYCVISQYYDTEKKGLMPLATIVLEDGIELTQAEQKEFIENLINTYFVSNPNVSSRQIPTKFRFRSSLPETKNGKINYKAIADEGLTGEETSVILEETNIAITNITVVSPDNQILKLK